MRAGNADGNLSVMKLLTDEARAEIAAGWLNSSLTQTEFARHAGISPRTLRLYVQRHAGLHAERQPEPGREVFADAQKVQTEIDRLGARLDRLQESVDRVVAGLAALEPDLAARHAAARVGSTVEAADDLVASAVGNGEIHPVSLSGDCTAAPMTDAVLQEALPGAGVAPCHPNAGGTPSEPVARSAVRKRGLFTDLLQEDIDTQERQVSAVDAVAVDKEEQHTIPNVEPAVAAEVPVLPLPMPPMTGTYWG